MPTPDTTAPSLPEFWASLRHTGLVQRLIDLAFDEDLAANGDVTSAACIPDDRHGHAAIIARSGGVVAGLAARDDLAASLANRGLRDVRMVLHAHDADLVAPGTTIATIAGPMRTLLALERTLLNLLARLSGVATLTRRYAEAIPQGSRARVYDTRKTTPGLRVLEKYAVRCGGGCSHRLGLHDAVLIKDNHIAGIPSDRLAKFVAAAAKNARLHARPAFVEVEADSLDQFQALASLPAGTIDIVLLDNMTPRMLAQAAGIRDRLCPSLELEASGGVTLDSIAEVARTGVDRISVGAITHQAVSIDLAMDVVTA